MADSASPEDTLPEEESEFQKTVALIGGKERIYLVSDTCESKEPDGDDAGILQEFIGEMFPGSQANSGTQPHSSSTHSHLDPASENQMTSNEIPLTARPKDLDLSACSEEEGMEKAKLPACNGNAQRTAYVNVSSSKRTIDSPIIIFIFRQTFLSKRLNHLCLKEILKDVKARMKRARIARPALIGLIRTSHESAETHECAQLLERLLRSVFHKHSPETIWVSCLIPKNESNMLTVKKNACRLIHSSQTADNTRDRGNPLLWPFQCLFWPGRRGPRGQANGSSTSRERDDSESIEESIPLKAKSLSTGAPVGAESPGRDS